MPGSQPEGSSPAAGNADSGREVDTGLMAALMADVGTPADADAPIGQAGQANDQGDRQGDSPAPEDKAPADESRESLLDVTRNAVDETADDPDGADGDAKAADKDGEGDAKPESAEADPSVSDEEAEPPFHEHPRWKKLQAERVELRQKVEFLEPDATKFRQIQDFMAGNDLTPDDVRQGFAIMAALRRDPAEAWELMKPIVQSVQAFVGNQLPDDIQEKVDTGLIDDETARELARLRHAATFKAERDQRQAAQVQQRQTQEQAEAAQQARVSAVDQWFVGQQADPDFEAIVPHLEGAILRTQRAWARQGRSFDAPQDAVKVAQEAFAAVRKTLAPRRQPVRNTPSSPPPAAAPRAAQPASLMDALRASIAA